MDDSHNRDSRNHGSATAMDEKEKNKKKDGHGHSGKDNNPGNSASGERDLEEKTDEGEKV